MKLCRYHIGLHTKTDHSYMHKYPPPTFFSNYSCKYFLGPGMLDPSIHYRAYCLACHIDSISFIRKELLIVRYK